MDNNLKNHEKCYVTKYCATKGFYEITIGGKPLFYNRYGEVQSITSCGNSITITTTKNIKHYFIKGSEAFIEKDKAITDAIKRWDSAEKQANIKLRKIERWRKSVE